MQVFILCAKRPSNIRLTGNAYIGAISAMFFSRNRDNSVVRLKRLLAILYYL